MSPDYYGNIDVGLQTLRCMVKRPLWQGAQDWPYQREQRHTPVAFFFLAFVHFGRQRQQTANGLHRVMQPVQSSGAPGRNRTLDQELRRLLLYPTELRARSHPSAYSKSARPSSAAPARDGAGSQSRRAVRLIPSCFTVSSRGRPAGACQQPEPRFLPNFRFCHSYKKPRDCAV